jgi:outer membrane putative beta-barrel porin/alpha-amylase
VLVAVSARPACAQQSLTDVLSFLLTNRSIPTGDFVQDEQAANAARDTISGLLHLELTTLPLSSSASGFTYRLNRSLGTVERSSDSFGPFFTERPLTAGRRQSSFGFALRSATFDNIDGRNLRDGTLVATASKLRGEAQPFDVEAVTLHIHTDTMTLWASHAPAERLEVSAALPLVRITLHGQRTDTYRGTQLIQATASAASSGIGDLVLRAKYNMIGSGGSGFAIGSEARLPTGSNENLIGAGEATFKPRVMASIEHDRVGLVGAAGYAFGGPSREVTYDAAVTVVPSPRLTFVGELVGRRFGSFGRLTETTVPHPRLVGIDTIRLTSSSQPTNRIVTVAGIRWNPVGTWLVGANALCPLTTAGLNTRCVPMVTLDYAYGL